MTALLGLAKALLRRLWGLVYKVVTITVRPPVRLVKALGQRTVSGVPVAMGRHRDRVSRDESYARQIGASIAALVTTLLDSAPYASLAVILLTTWLGTVTPGEDDPPYPASTSLAAKVRDQQERSLAKDPIPLWDRFPFE